MFCLLIAGCAAYRYEISSPDAPNRQISKDSDLTIPADPARLLFRQSGSRCVLFVDNPGEQDFAIDGSGSAIVDPEGVSHAVAGRVLPPGSRVKFILPPMRDTNDEPRFGIGLGVGMRVDAAPLDRPRRAQYLSVSTDGQEFWSWDGQKPVQLVFTFRQGDQSRKYSLTLSRSK